MTMLDGSLTLALVEAVKALGGSKVVGCKLWPEKAPDAAQRLLLDCLNDDRPAHLTPEHVVLILRLARQAGHHGAVGWLLAERECAELAEQLIAESTGKLGTGVLPVVVGGDGIVKDLLQRGDLGGVHGAIRVALFDD